MTITKFEFQHSLKNIPIPTIDNYLRLTITKTEEFIQRLRWKTLFFLKPNDNDKQNKNNFGFKTKRNAPQIPELVPFENDLTNMIANLEFKNTKNEFQKQLVNDTRKIKKSKNIFVNADKTHNIYEMNKNKYDTLMNKNVTSIYKKAKNNTLQDINKEAKNITDKLNISDRVEQIALKEAYITVKDHKPQFPNDIKCRLINPTKTNIGCISKKLLDGIIYNVKSHINVKLLKNTTETIDWFNNINYKSNKSFIQLDIVDYYPSVSEDLFNEAIQFAEQFAPISNDDKKILKNARKSVLYHKNDVWEKQTGLFDITMGAFDGAQITDLVGLMILQKLKENVPQIKFALYRDDGIGVHSRIPASQMEKIKKQIYKIFKDYGLKITIETNLPKVNFLDITMDLTNGTFQPFRKPNDSPLYINSKSNHPYHIIKNLPIAINKRLSEISSNENVFNNHKNEYQNALRNSGHNAKLKFQKNEQKKRTKNNRNRNIIWYNPPFNMALKTNIGKTFLKLIDKHFPKNHQLNKIINRKNVKISYSCCPNIQNIINSHNRKILEDRQQTVKENKDCNCQQKQKCPLNNKCCTNCVVYKATINNEKTNYIGMTQGKFKDRFTQHKHSFKNQSKKYATTLSTYAWDKQINTQTEIKWNIIKKCSVYKPGNSHCDLCLSEKLFIIKNANNPNNINKRNDVGGKCMHTMKFLLDKT